MVKRGLSILRSLALKGSIALADQAVTSGTNFVISILLGRALSPADFGAYSLAYSILLFIAGFHNAGIIEPFSVYGAGRFREDFRSYVGALVKWQELGIGIICVLGLVLVVSLSGYFPDVMRSNGVGLLLSTPLIVLAWFFRRVYYVLGDPLWSLYGGILQSVLVLTGVSVGFHYLRSSGFLAFQALGVGTGAMAVFLWARTRPRIEWTLLPSEFERKVLRTHWEYGRWGLLTNIVYWFSGYGYTSLIGAFLGLSEIGALRAMQNLVNPLGLVLTALSTIMVPWMVRGTAQRGYRWLSRTVPLVAVAFAALACLVLGPVVLLGHQFDDILYDGRYAGFVWLLPFGALVQVFSAFTSAVAMGLQVLERPRRIFYGYAAAALTTVTFGFPAVYYRGLLGAMFGTVVTAGVLSGVVYWNWNVECRARTSVADERCQKGSEN